MHRASAIVALTRKSFVAGVGLQYVSANNALRLPAHLNASLGVQAALAGGTLTVSGRNVLHGYPGLFTSPAYAVPYTTSLGTIVPLATPQLSTWTVRYDFGTRARR